MSMAEVEALLKLLAEMEREELDLIMQERQDAVLCTQRRNQHARTSENSTNATSSG